MRSLIRFSPAASAIRLYFSALAAREPQPRTFQFLACFYTFFLNFSCIFLADMEGVDQHPKRDHMSTNYKISKQKSNLGNNITKGKQMISIKWKYYKGEKSPRARSK